jgi:imidazolonepropionase-like amidohydrolase
LVPANPGLPPEAVLNFMGLMKTSIPEVADASQAAAATQRLLDAGVDAIKLFGSSPSGASLSESAIQAAVAEAHGSGRLVFVHPNTAADVLAAVRGGVDIIAHTTPRSGPWDESVLRAMKEAGVALIPTLQLWKYFTRHDRLSVQRPVVETAARQLRAWLDIGGEVLFGTDLGAVEYDPTDEYVLMAEAGMRFRQILAALTTAPAQRFAEAGGRLAQGLPADLVAVRGDTSQNIRALTAIEYTIRNGKIIYCRDTNA